MFRGFSIVHGDCNNVRFGYKSVYVIVVLGSEWGIDTKATTVEVDKERKLLVLVGELCWEVKAGGDRIRGIGFG